MSRQLRVNLGRLDNAAATRALSKYQPLIESMTRRFRDRDDARAIARYAVLEAYVRALPNEPEPGLVRGCVRWRLSDHLKAVLRAEPPHHEPDADLRVASPPPERRRAAVTQLHQELAVTALSPRQRHVVAGVLRGLSQVALAREMGLSGAEVSRIFREARRQLMRQGQQRPQVPLRSLGRPGTGRPLR